MIREAIQLIQETAVAAQASEVLHETAREITYRLGEDLKIIDKLPPPHDHLVRSIDDLATALGAFSDDPGRAAVFHGEKEIVLLLDREDRRDRVRMALIHHEKWTLMLMTHRKDDLAQLRPASDSLFTQQNFVSWLRALGDSVSAELLLKVRSVAFERKAGAAGEVGHQRESLGRSVEASVASTQGDLPETFCVFCPIYAGEPQETLSRVSIKMRLDILKDSGCFIVSPLPGEIDFALDKARKEIGQYLRKEFPEDVPVIGGECN